MIRGTILSVFLFTMLSCTAQRITGTWELTQMVIGLKEKVTIKIAKGAYRYYTMEFQADGLLVIGGHNGSNSPPLPYTLRNDTIRITAVNGHISVVPVICHTQKELRTLDILDSTISIYRRIR